MHVLTYAICMYICIFSMGESKQKVYASEFLVMVLQLFGGFKLLSQIKGLLGGLSSVLRHLQMRCLGAHDRLEWEALGGGTGWKLWP